MSEYEIYFVVNGIPFTTLVSSYSAALKECNLLELDNSTDKYELRQIIKTYDRKNIKSRPEQNNYSGGKQQDTSTCKNVACRHKQICRQFSLFEKN